MTALIVVDRSAACCRSHTANGRAISTLIVLTDFLSIADRITLRSRKSQDKSIDFFRGVCYRGFVATRKRKQSKPKPATVRYGSYRTAVPYLVYLYGRKAAEFGWETHARQAVARINRILAKREKEPGRG